MDKFSYEANGYNRDEVNQFVNDVIKEKIKERSDAKKNKDFAKADSIRDELLDKGIKLIDTREGTTYELL
mgnify:CR=1 FL=1